MGKSHFHKGIIFSNFTNTTQAKIMNEDSKLWYFEDVNLFEILCPHKVQTIDQRHEFNYFDKNAFIYFPNEVANHIYMIADGRVKIGHYTDDGKEVVKAILTEGEIFGELTLTGEDKRTDFAQAMDDKTTVCPITVEEMQ